MALLTNGLLDRGALNTDVRTGGFRRIDLQKEPFNLRARAILDYDAGERKRVLMWGTDPALDFQPNWTQKSANLT
jgi:hypothetical protein